MTFELQLQDNLLQIACANHSLLGHHSPSSSGCTEHYHAQERLGMQLAVRKA